MADDPGGAKEAVLRGSGSGVSTKDGLGGLAANDALAKEQAVTAKVPNGCPPGSAVEVIGIGIAAAKEAQDQIE